MHAQAGGRGKEGLLLLIPHLGSVVACVGEKSETAHPPRPRVGPWARTLASLDLRGRGRPAGARGKKTLLRTRQKQKAAPPPARLTDDHSLVRDFLDEATLLGLANVEIKTADARGPQCEEQQ